MADTPDDTEGDFWRDVKPDLLQRSKEKRASNREQSAALLRQRGIRFDERNDGAHLIVQHGQYVYDFWPGTGLWQKRGESVKGRGVRHLIRHITDGERGAVSPSCAATDDQQEKS